MMCIQVGIHQEHNCYAMVNGQSCDLELRVYVIVMPWVVGVYQNKCLSNHGITILYPD